MTDFKSLLEGIPTTTSRTKKKICSQLSHAPKRKAILNAKETQLALQNALRYFPPHFHQTLAKEFLSELNEYGRIYMYRFMPDYKIYARPIEEYPGHSFRLNLLCI